MLGILFVGWQTGCGMTMVVMIVTVAEVTVVVLTAEMDVMTLVVLTAEMVVTQVVSKGMTEMTLGQ